MMYSIKSDPDKKIAVGVCGIKYPNRKESDPLEIVEDVAAHGLDGVFFRHLYDISPTLDNGYLREVKQKSEELGLYLETGFGRVNPYNISEDPHIRRLGDGDYLRGAERIIEAAAKIECHTLWAHTGAYQGHAWGIFANDRFRTDVEWSEQLEATSRNLHNLMPIFAATDSRIALETHEEITTFELARLRDENGPRVGVTLDLANVVVRGENPLEATKRVAHMVYKTHFRDICLFHEPGGLFRQIRAVGDGIIDYAKIIRTILQADSSPNISIESSWKDYNAVPIKDPRWLTVHPDLSRSELNSLCEIADECDKAVKSGTLVAPDDYYGVEYSYEREMELLMQSASRLRKAAEHAKDDSRW